MSETNDLHKMTHKELGELFPIIIQDYTKKWKEFYQTERELIIDSFTKSEILSIEHIGSTSIPGLKAKPTIDILMQVSERIDTRRLEDVFQSLGYQLTKQAENPPPHMTFVKGYSPHGFIGQAFHVHVRYKGDWDEIRFRDYLLSNQEIAKDYEALKLQLADKYKNDREAYTDSKTDFIEKINKLTRKLRYG